MSIYSLSPLRLIRRLWGQFTNTERFTSTEQELDDELEPQRKRLALQSILRAANYIRPYKKFAILSIFLTVLGAGASLLAPWPLKVLIDNVLEGHPLPPLLANLVGPLAHDRVALLVAVAFAGFLVTLLINAISVIDNYVNTSLEQRMVLDFRSELFDHVEHLPLAFYDKKKTGSLMYRLNNQASSIGSITMTIPQIGQSLLILLGMLWIVYQFDPWLAVLSATVVPVLYWSFSYYTKYIEKHLRYVRGLEARSLSIVYEAVAMIRVITAFGREDYESKRFKSLGEEAVDARVRLTVRQTLFSLGVNSNTAAGLALVLGFGAYRVLQGGLTVGELLVVVAYVQAIYKPLESISTMATSIHERLIGLNMAFDLLDTEPEVKDAPDAVEVERIQGNVRFEHVNFSYAERKETLKDISFEAAAGQVIGIVGPTGAGKSTLVSLIPRFADPQEGRILLDGVNLRKIKLQSLRSHISLVLQEPLLFSGTIADNIRYGRLEASMEDIIEAAKAANAHDFIMKLPKKYDTLIGERGTTLSGGERQRVSIARAFLKDAPILILDEPTSSVDSKTEAVILEALRRLMVGRTTFMIAHRLSTLTDADKILVIDCGNLVEQGSHDELINLNGLYKQMHDVQTRRAQKKSKELEKALAG
jgi:ATP-binding cassette, subfamily B, bacterial